MSVRPRDVTHHVAYSYLHDILDVLLHHVHIPAIVELLHLDHQLVEVQHDLLSAVTEVGLTWGRSS